MKNQKVLIGSLLLTSSSVLLSACAFDSIDKLNQTENNKNLFNDDDFVRDDNIEQNISKNDENINDEKNELQDKWNNQGGVIISDVETSPQEINESLPINNDLPTEEIMVTAPPVDVEQTIAETTIAIATPTSKPQTTTTQPTPVVTKPLTVTPILVKVTNTPTPTPTNKPSVVTPIVTTPTVTVKPTVTTKPATPTNVPTSTPTPTTKPTTPTPTPTFIGVITPTPIPTYLYGAPPAPIPEIEYPENSTQPLLYGAYPMYGVETPTLEPTIVPVMYGAYPMYGVTPTPRITETPGGQNVLMYGVIEPPYEYEYEIDDSYVIHLYGVPNKK